MNDAIDALLAVADPAADAPMLADLPQAALAAHSGPSDYRDDVIVCQSLNHAHSVLLAVAHRCEFSMSCMK